MPTYSDTIKSIADHVDVHSLNGMWNFEVVVDYKLIIQALMTPDISDEDRATAERLEQMLYEELLYRMRGGSFL